MTQPPTPDPWAKFPGGNPFGPSGPFGPGGPFGGSSPFGAGPPTGDIDAWFRQMGIDPADFRRLVDEMQRNLGDAFRKMGTDPSKSFVSGFTVRLGPDGKPQFSSFGNKPQVRVAGPVVPGVGKLPTVVADEREPLTDVLEEGDRIAVTMELPGVEKKDIKLNVNETELEISVDNERRKYHKRVRMPAKVDPKTTKATYTNGILDITIQRTGTATGGLSVAIE